MSWLSNLTGIHIGSGPTAPSLQPPPEVATDPSLAAAWAEFQKNLNGTIGQAHAMNNGAIGLAGATAGAGALGLLGGAGGAAGATQAGAAMGDAASGGSGILGTLEGLAKGAGGDILGAIKNYGGDALAGLNIYEAAKRQGQADKYAQSAYDTSKSAYDAKAPLRLAGQTGMLTAGNANPFAQHAIAPGAPAAPSAPALPSSGFPLSPDPRRRQPVVPPIPMAGA